MPGLESDILLSALMCYRLHHKTRPMQCNRWRISPEGRRPVIRGPEWVAQMAFFAYFCNLNITRRLNLPLRVAYVVLNASYPFRYHSVPVFECQRSSTSGIVGDVSRLQEKEGGYCWPWCLIILFSPCFHLHTSRKWHT